MIKQGCIGIPDIILLLMKDENRNNNVLRRGLFLYTAIVHDIFSRRILSK